MIEKKIKVTELWEGEAAVRKKSTHEYTKTEEQGTRSCPLGYSGVKSVES
jgi:hypothetical protein